MWVQNRRHPDIEALDILLGQVTVMDKPLQADPDPTEQIDAWFRAHKGPAADAGLLNAMPQSGSSS